MLFCIHGENVAELEAIVDDAGRLPTRINERSLEEIRIKHRLIQQLCAEITPKPPVIWCAEWHEKGGGAAWADNF